MTAATELHLVERLREAAEERELIDIRYLTQTDLSTAALEREAADAITDAQAVIVALRAELATAQLEGRIRAKPTDL